MKRYLLLLLIAFVSCKKDKNTPQEPPSVNGVWEIRAHYGEPPNTRTYSPGNDTTLTFTANTYAYYIAGRLITNGTYKAIVIRVDNTPNPYKVYKLEFDNNEAGGFLYTIEGSKLTFRPAGYYTWGFTTIYERKY